MSTSMKGFFANRFIQAIMLSNLFLQIGIWVRNYAVLLYVMEMTNNNAFAVSMVSVAEFAPIFIFSFIGGTFADRWRPKRTMVVCDLLSALSIFAVLGALVYGSWKAVFFATLVSAIVSQFSQPSGMKLFKHHVPAEQMQSGMAMFQTVIALFLVIGPVIGTFVYQTYGIDTAIVIMGVAFVLSAVTLTFLPPDQKEEGEKQPTTVMTEMKAGFRYVMDSPVLRRLGGAFLFAGLALGVIQPLGIFLIVEQLGLPKENFQWMMVAMGVAMMLGGGLAMGITKKVPAQTLLMIGILASAVTTALMGWSTVFALTLALQFINGLFMPCINIGINTLMLQSTDEAFVGRVNGILNPMFTGAMVVTMSVSGMLKETLSLVLCYQIAGALFLASVLMVVPLLRVKLQAQPKEQQ